MLAPRMKQFSIVHEFPCNEARFWQIFFDPAYLADLYREGLKVADLAVLERTETDTEIRRKISGRPQLKLPAAVQKIVGDRLGFTEEGRFDKQAQRWRFSFVTTAFGDKVRSEGTIRLEPAGPGKVRRVADCTIDAKIFGMGGLIESNMETQMRETMASAAAFTAAWLARNPG